MASALLDGAADIFERGGRKPVSDVDEETVRSLHAKIVGGMRLTARLRDRVAVKGRHRILDHPLQPSAATHCHGGQPPAVVYFNTIETDQQVQAVA